MQVPSSFSRSLSAPSKLDRSASVQQGIQDVLRLQRWRTAVQRKHHLSASEESEPQEKKTFVATVDEIFTFIGSDPEKAVRRFPSGELCNCVPLEEVYGTCFIKRRSPRAFDRKSKISLLKTKQAGGRDSSTLVKYRWPTVSERAFISQ